MKLTKLHLIIILALALILCPVLGVCYNTREGFDETQNLGGMTNNNSGQNNEKEEEEEEMDYSDSTSKTIGIGGVKFNY